jgi:L-alanine-DL-glutamate epimerase-like enolase superfamily enzyme
VAVLAVVLAASSTGLLNRPEIPRLAGLNKPLLVKAYDLGLVDALGRTEGRPVRQLLEAAQAEVRLYLGWVGGWESCLVSSRPNSRKFRGANHISLW